MKKQAIIVLVAISVVLLVVVGWQLFTTGSPVFDPGNDIQIVPTDDPLDIVMELYNPWLTGLRSTSTEFNAADLLVAAPITEALRVRLLSSIDTQSAVDPVLCQAELPDRVGAKSVFTTDTEAQVMIIPRGKKVPEQALVTMTAVDGQWFISDIVCSRGELAPELEYTFEREGNLLKQSLQPPLDANQWHLIYTRDDVAGNAIPLEFNSESICVASDGSEQVCVPDQLAEATAVKLQGAMQESGVVVQRMQIQ